MNKEIYLISESNDPSTNLVIDWLSALKKQFIRKNVDIDFNDFNILIDDENHKTSIDNYLIWNRRGYIPIIPVNTKISSWTSYLKKEQLPVLETFEIFNKHNYIGSYFKELHNNKIINLKIAKDIGFTVPRTIITNNKKDLQSFINSNRKYITKSLVHSPLLETEESYYTGNGTVFFDIDLVSDFFAPSLVQEYIEKDIEIRVFFIMDKFYSMAIFSQKDEQTKVDFRNYNDENPNRNVPFILPTEVLNKLKLFVKRIDCNTGSIDLILSPEGTYVFLEINPMGQYDWVSQNCNYYIDKTIAEMLIKKSKIGSRNKKTVTT
jgi:ATP-GRASP peptide maturase of grasp-with-spasm system